MPSLNVKTSLADTAMLYTFPHVRKVHLHRTGTKCRLHAVKRTGHGVISSIAYVKLLYVPQLHVCDVPCHSRNCCVYL